MKTFYEAIEPVDFDPKNPQWLLSKVPPERNPNVLMRALENACEAMRVPQGGTFTPLFYIQQAIRELESEAGDEK